MITIIARLKAKPGKESLLAEECKKIIQQVRENEKGCLMYIPHVAVENPAEIVYMEKYVDKESFDAHLKTPYFKSLARKFGELLDGEIQTQFLEEL